MNEKLIIMTKNEQPSFVKVKRIKEISFSINELLLDDPSKTISMDMGQEFGFVLEDNLIGLTLRMFYHYPNDLQNILAEINVQNIFEIENLKQFLINEAEIKLPEETITTIVGESIAHLRALLAKNLFGTALQEKLPALVNPRKVARYFYPQMFEPETSIKELIKDSY
jgi:hypothetical protein